VRCAALHPEEYPLILRNMRRTSRLDKFWKAPETDYRIPLPFFEVKMATIASIDLDVFSAKQLTELIQAAEAKRQEKAQKERRDLLAEVTRRAGELGLSFEELVGTRVAKPKLKTRQDTGSKVAAKFRGPNGEEWTGRGRMPNWLVAQEATGRKRDEFLIK
jgi:DNA-binding protein H-NS